MRVVSVNVAEPQQVASSRGAVLTSIFKQRVEGPVAVRRRNLAGDRQADLRAHGGADKAVYAYPVEHYGVWERELERSDFAYGQFGENLTTEGLLEDTVRIGDRFRIGSALLEVSQPRFPCFKLGIRMGDSGFVKGFLQSRRLGFYLRVIEEGAVCAGDAIERTAQGVHTVRAVCDITFARPRDEAGRERLFADEKLAGAWKNLMREFA